LEAIDINYVSGVYISAKNKIIFYIDAPVLPFSAPHSTKSESLLYFFAIK